MSTLRARESAVTLTRDDATGSSVRPLLVKFVGSGGGGGGRIKRTSGKMSRRKRKARDFVLRRA